MQATEWTSAGNAGGPSGSHQLQPWVSPKCLERWQWLPLALSAGEGASPLGVTHVNVITLEPR